MQAIDSNVYSYLISNETGVLEGIQPPTSPSDSLPHFNVEVFDILADYLAAECGIPFPGLGYREVIGNCTVVSRMTWSEAKVLQTRLVKRPIPSLSEVMSLYGEAYRGDREWATFLMRQRTLFASDAQQLVLVVSALHH